MRCCDRVKFACAAASLSLVSGSHQNRIIHGRAKLDRTENAALEELKADGTLQAIVDKYIKAE